MGQPGQRLPTTTEKSKESWVGAKHLVYCSGYTFIELVVVLNIADDKQ
jgi:hypothetical protein